jgi:hypothetical protein
MSGRTGAEHFWSRTTPEPNTGCWLWTGAVNRQGYGRASCTWLGMFKNPHALCHRIAWCIANGRPIPAGAWVLHRCDNGPLGCVNPDHLVLGTAKENSQQMWDRGRHPIDRRTPLQKTKLTLADVRRLLDARASGTSIIKLGEMFGISDSHAHHIAHGWRYASRRSRALANSPEA